MCPVAYDSRGPMVSRESCRCEKNKDRFELMPMIMTMPNADVLTVVYCV